MAWLQRLPKRPTLLAGLSNVGVVEEVQQCQSDDASLFLDGEQATTTTFFSSGDRNTSDNCFMTEDCSEISWQDIRRSHAREPPYAGATAQPRQWSQRLRAGQLDADVDAVGFHPMGAQPQTHLRDLTAAPTASDPSVSAACNNRESTSLTALSGPPPPVITPILKQFDACTVGESPLPVATPISKRRAEAAAGEARQLRARHSGSRDAQTLRLDTSERAASIGDSGAVSIDLTSACESQLDGQITSPNNPQPQLGECLTVEASAWPASSSRRQASQAVVVAERSATSSSSSNATPVTVVASASDETAILQETVRTVATTRRSTEQDDSSRRLQGDGVAEDLMLILDDSGRGGGFPTRPRATVQPPRQRASMTSDFEIAMALQLEEGTAADVPVHERTRPHSGPRMCLYAIEPSRSAVRCFTCREPIQRGTPRVLFMRQGRRNASSVHTMCVTATSGLIQPQPGIPVDSGDGRSAWSAFFDSRLGEDDRVEIARVLEQLPQVPATALQPFLWPLPPRPPSRRSEFRAQLLQSDRDFTAEDYELLLELDNHGGNGSGSSRASKEEADFKSALLARLPVTKLPNSVVDTQCSICLDAMESGSEVRTLPCMHMFHRHCIDRWLMTPGPPRCPVDQVEVQL